MTANRKGVSFGGDENILQSGSGEGCTFLNMLKIMDLSALKR